MRAKILEGMALGKVVISTRLGLEGIPAKHRKQVLVADTAEEFIEQLHYCQQLPLEQLRQMGEDAQDFVHKHYDSQETANALMKRYQELMVGAL